MQELTLQLLLLGPIEERTRLGEHRDDSQNLLGAVVLLTREDTLAQRRIHGELGHPPSHLGKLSLVVERAESVKEVQGANERIAWRRVEEVEADEIVDAKGFEHKDYGAEIRALNLGNRVLVQLVCVGVLGVEAEALARADSSCSTGALTCCCSRALW